MDAHLQVGQAQPPEQVEALGRQPVLRHVQQVQAGPLGLRRPQQRRLPAQVTPGPASSDTRWSRPGVTRRSGPGRVLGQAATATHPRRWTASACACSRRSTVAARCAVSFCSLADHEPQSPRRMGAVAHGDPQGGAQTSDHRQRRNPARRTGTSRSTHTRSLPTATPHRRRHLSPALLLLPVILWACLSRMR